MVNFKLRF